MTARVENGSLEFPPGASDSSPGGPEPGQRLQAILRAGHFAVTTELPMPDSADPQCILRRARAFDGWVDAINATDGSGANPHVSSVAASAVLARAGYCPVMQITCRDRNRIAIQSDVLGAAMLGVGAVLCLTGDRVGAGDHPGAKPVFDLEGPTLIDAIRRMRDDARYLSGRVIADPPRMFIGAAENPFAPPLESRPQRLRMKIEAGAQFVQTQYCFDLPVLAEFMRRVREMGLDEKAHILIGVGPLASAGAARWLRANVAGVHVPDALITRLEGAHDQAAEGRMICVELMQQIREIKGVSGVHLMAFRQEEWVAGIVRDSGVLGGRKPARSGAGSRD